MNEASNQTCDSLPLSAYLAETLDAEEASRVEQHLDQCPACAKRIQQQAAGDADWAEFADMLSEDGLDAEQPSACDVDFDPLVAASAKDLPARAVTSAMLAREIRGWLDPTDDPRMLGRFAGYEIAGVIGHGGMGIVLKGFEVSLNRYVAIKAMAPRLASSQAARKRFAREAQAAAAITHENIIAIHRVDQSHGLPFLVMSYSGGVSLQQKIDREGPLPLEDALRIASQIAAGLAAAHAKGLIHRDIKPANILLGSGVDRVKITDFGLARAADDASFTRTGMIAGTPQFMSPEQARGRKLDARSDLFSLGSVLYTMLTARPPFEGETSYEIVDAVAQKQPAMHSGSLAELPDWSKRLLVWMLQKDAHQRIESATQTQGILDSCLQHLQDPASPLPQSLQKRLSKKTLRIASAFAAVGASVLMVAAVMQFEIFAKPAPGKTLKSGEPVATENRATQEVFAMETLAEEMDQIEQELSQLEQQSW